MKIKVFADTICGWSYIGHARLNKALEEFKDIKFKIEHMPFQLNPDMPKDGIERSRYLEIKFGSTENAQPMYDRMVEEANKEGLNFNLDAIKKTPNTVLSHLLINLSEKENKQNEIKEKIEHYYPYIFLGLPVAITTVLTHQLGFSGLYNLLAGFIMTLFSMFAYFKPNKKNNISSIAASFFLSFGFVLVSTFFTAFPIWMLVFLFN